MEYKYCFEHGMAGVENSPVGDCHSIFYFDDFTYQNEVDWCFFEHGWATSEPPVNFEDDWDLNIQEPGQEELKQMDECAENLVSELLC